MTSFHKNVLKLLLVFFIVAAVTAGCGGGGGGGGSTSSTNVTGIVRSTSGTPVQGVQVTINGTNTSATTNTQGTFTLNNVSEGNLTLRLSKTGYTTQEIVVTAVKDTTVSLSTVIGAETYVVTGTVRDYNSEAPVVGAVVTIGSKTVNTDANGNYRLGFATAPTSATWSVNGSNATPSPGYYTHWARMGIVTSSYNPLSLPMPSISTGSNLMPIVYLWSKSSPPPY